MAKAKLTAEAKKIIAGAGPALIATASKNGKSHVQVKGSFRIIDDGTLVFVDIDSPRTMANLRDNPQLSTMVFDPEAGQSCRIWGKAEILTKGELFDEIKEELLEKKRKLRHLVLMKIGEVEVF
jgi:predicted pyridoxine 5'-phosphate oxidase superfamily flavin-nucleotide-binding protein